jgi:hypothetical protein
VHVRIVDPQLEHPHMTITQDLSLTGSLRVVT